MAKKTLGYAELYWVCPNCDGINPGPEKTCTQCGAPQPGDVEFQQADRIELLTSDAVKEKVGAGADIHCPYCGARNPGDAETCSQCGGDIAEGERRESGQVLGAFQTGPVKEIPCPHCGAANPDTATHCAGCGGSMYVQQETEPPVPQSRTSAPDPTKRKFPWGLIIVLITLCCVVGVFMLFMLRTEETTGTVEQVRWERTIAIEGLVMVQYADWDDRIPPEGEITNCTSEVRSVQSEPAAGAEEVCGTPYSVDTGSGYAEVVQDCEYHLYDDYCSYEMLEWSTVDTAQLTGSDFYPVWPEPQLVDEQRLGSSNETYTVIFDTDSGNLPYTTSYESWQQFEIGSTWNLEVNALGGIVSVSP